MNRSYPLAPPAACAAFAAEVGSCAESLFARPEVCAEAVARMLAGVDLRDAVLGIAFEHFERGGEGKLWTEMLSYAYEDVRRAGSKVAGPRRKAQGESTEVLHSMLIAIWEGARGFQYRTYPAFLTFLAKGFEWRSKTHVRRTKGIDRRAGGRNGSEALEHEQVESSAPSQAETLEREEIRMLVEAVLADTPAEDRRIFEERYYEDRSLSELARERGVHRSVIKRRIDRILNRLRPRGS